MSFPEWGQSYNALHVPLTSDWQCSLVPAGDVEEPTSWWSRSYDEREQKRKDRERQIEQDRQDFDWLFRLSIGRTARFCNDFSAYTAFLREHLQISWLSAPVDGEGVTRILRDAVRDGRLVPAINRAWRGSRRVARPYAPQSWPKRAPDPKPTVYGVRNGEFVPLDKNGYFIDRTPYVPVLANLRNAARASGEGDWLNRVAAGGVLGGGSGALGVADITDGNESTPLGDAQPFDYAPPDKLSDDVAQLAARGFSEAGEAECFAQYERDMDLCNAVGGPMGGSRGIALCKQQAFQNYQQCRGY